MHTEELTEDQQLFWDAIKEPLILVATYGKPEDIAHSFGRTLKSESIENLHLRLNKLMPIIFSRSDITDIEKLRILRTLMQVGYYNLILLPHKCTWFGTFSQKFRSIIGDQKTFNLMCPSYQI